MRYVLAFVALIMFTLVGCGAHEKHHEGNGETHSDINNVVLSDVENSDEKCGGDKDSGKTHFVVVGFESVKAREAFEKLEHKLWEVASLRSAIPGQKDVVVLEARSKLGRTHLLAKLRDLTDVQGAQPVRSYRYDLVVQFKDAGITEKKVLHWFKGLGVVRVQLQRAAGGRLFQIIIETDDKTDTVLTAIKKVKHIEFVEFNIRYHTETSKEVVSCDDNCQGCPDCCDKDN